MSLKKDDIVFYTPTYCDIVALKRNQESIRKMGFPRIVVDGRFKNNEECQFPQINGSDYSRDGTKEYCESIGTHYFRCKPCKEEEKVNFAMEKAHELGYKVFIMVGADTYLSGDPAKFMRNMSEEYEKTDTNPRLLMMESKEHNPEAKWNNNGTQQARIWLNYHKLELRNLHWVVYEKGSPDDQPYHYEVDVLVKGLTINHDNTVRPSARDMLMTKYQDKNVPRERQMYAHHVVKKARKFTSIYVCDVTKKSWAECREELRNSHHTHVLISYGLDDVHYYDFLNILTIRNNILQDLPVITAVNKVGKTRYSLYNEDLEQPKINENMTLLKQIYSKEGAEYDKANNVIVIPWTLGKLVCMQKEIALALEDVSDPMMLFCHLAALGRIAYADTRIRV